MLKKMIALALILFVAGGVLYAQRKPAKEPKPSKNAVQQAPAAQPAPAPQPARPASPFFTGDGGSGKTLTIMELKGNGLTKELGYISSVVQGRFVTNMSTYSAFKVLDRQSLEKAVSETESGIYADSTDVIQLGKITQADLIMQGTITRTTAGFALQINISETKGGTTVASYTANSNIADMDNFTSINLASLDILPKLGVELTERSKTELSAAASKKDVAAQTALAQGIASQRQGTTVEALSYFMQSASYDPSLAEAASRLNILTANVTSGNIGANVRNDLQWRDQWVARLKECEEFYVNYVNYLKNPPPYSLVYSTDIKQGEIDYEKRTVSLSFNLGLYTDAAWHNTIDQVVKTVRQGLMATKRAEVWKLDKWPEVSISAINPFVDRINGLTVEVEILNSEGKSINAKRIVGFPYGFFVIEHLNETTKLFENINYALPLSGDMSVIFPNANPDAITDNLTIKITRIDGQPAETAARQRNINIIPNASGLQTNVLHFYDDRIKYYYTNYPRNNENSVTYWRIRSRLDELSLQNLITIVHHGVTNIGSYNSSDADRLLSNHVFGVLYQFTYRCGYLILPSSVTSCSSFPRKNQGREYFEYMSIGANVRTQEPTSFPSYFSIVRRYTDNERKAGYYVQKSENGRIYKFAPR